MIISPLMLILIVLIILALSGSGYGYYNGGGYANPLAGLGVLLIIGLVLWLMFGGGISLSPPTERPRIEIEHREAPEREPGRLKIERERPSKELEKKEPEKKEPEKRERSLREQERPLKNSGEVLL